MNSKTFSQPSAQTYSVAELVAYAQAGRIRVPDFQRPLRWGWEDVRRLFDSIIKGYPIGSLLLWKRTGEAGLFHLGALSVHASAGEALWVVDGQQRLTSLASALTEEGSKDPRFALSYDLQEETFVHPDDKKSHLIPLHVLFDATKVLRWVRDNSELTDFVDRALQATTTIRDFKIPAYLVEQDDEQVLRDIFDRMNNYGRRLSRAEVFAALHPGSNEEGPERWFSSIIDGIERDLLFGRLDDDTVLRAILARRGADVTREIRDEFGKARQRRDFGEESERQAYENGEQALRRTIKFLIDAGVPHSAFLPYRYLLVVLTRFFAFFPEPVTRNEELLRRWFWRASLIGPNVYSGSWNHAMRTLAGLIDKNDEGASVQNLLRETDRTKERFQYPDLKRFRTNQADSKVALCALWSLGPRSIDTGVPYTRADLARVLGEDSTPRAFLVPYLSRPPADKRRWLANRFLHVPNETTVDDPPSDMQGIWQSHLIDGDLVEGDPNELLKARNAALEKYVRDYVLRVTGLELEDTPPLETFDLDEDEGEDEHP